MTRGHRKAEAVETPVPRFAGRHKRISWWNSLGLVVLLLVLAAAACFENTMATLPPKASASAAATPQPTASPAPTPTTPPRFSITGWMTTSGSGQTATLLADGTVLIADGSTVDGISDAEL